MYDKTWKTLSAAGCLLLTSGRVMVADESRQPEPTAMQTGTSYRVQMPKAAIRLDVVPAKLLRSEFLIAKENHR